MLRKGIATKTMIGASLLVLLGSGMIAKWLWFSPPMAEATLDVAPTVSNVRVFVCAERRIAELSASDDRWVPEITRRDGAIGRLESGWFPQQNVGGFRVRVDRPPQRDRIRLALKGAGAYFVDLGVEEAMTAFKTGLAKCLSTRV